MRVLRTFAVIALTIFPVAVGAESVFGIYQTLAGNNGGYAHVEIYPCEEKVCGVVRRAFADSGQEIKDDPALNVRIIWNMKPLGNGRYGGGKIYAVDRDQTFSATMTRKKEGLEVSGCLLLFCSSQLWKPVK